MNLETLRIRQKYRQYTRSELADLVITTVEKRDEDADPEWKRWFINYCLDDFHPRSLGVNPKDWCRWVAFVLRYIQPLVMRSLPIETRPVSEVMRRRPEVVKALMFGTRETMWRTLQSAYEIHADYRSQLVSLALDEDQQELFEKVLDAIKTADIRTLTGWSRYCLDARGQPLARQIHEAFYSVQRPTPGDIVKIIGEAQQSQTQARIRLEAYLSRALQDQADSGLTVHVLGYLNESERRSTLMLTYSRLFMRMAVVLLFFTVLAAVAARLTSEVVGILVAGIFSGLGVIDVLLMGVLGTVIFFYAVDSYTWTNLHSRHWKRSWVLQKKPKRAWPTAIGTLRRIKR